MVIQPTLDLAWLNRGRTDSGGLVVRIGGQSGRAFLDVPVAVEGSALEFLTVEDIEPASGSASYTSGSISRIRLFGTCPGTVRNSVHDVINKTRMVPITKHAVAYIAALAAVPFAFVWLLATPLERVVEEVVKRIL